jgi:hypothetical protein
MSTNLTAEEIALQNYYNTSATPINAGDTAYVIICSALVLLQTPGLAQFYGGTLQENI